MTRKFIVILTFALIMLASSFSAFAAGSVQLQVNGDAVPSPGVDVVNSMSMISVDTYAQLAGADVQWLSADELTITENGVTLNLSVGQKEATLADQAVTLPVGPVKEGDNVLIPLRPVCEAFGFDVDWDGQKWLVTLTRDETRDGMTVSDLLVKSTEASLAYESYSMEGTFNIDMDIKADGEAMEQAPNNITSRLTGQIQNEPFQVYMMQKLNPVDGDSTREMTVETYMNQEKMYIKAPGQDWLVQDLPFSPEFWKQQQDIQNDPLKAAEQMKEMGILLNFGDDVIINGVEYYVVNAAMDMEKFKEGYQNMLQQAVQGMPQDTTSNPVDVQNQMQDLIDNAELDYNYSVLINKETLISDIVKFDARLKMTMENPAPVTPEGEQKDNEPQEVTMDLTIKGDISITDLGAPFSAPDVSSARELETPAEPLE